MPRHKHVTDCLKGGGPISKFCTCSHCTLCVCSICGAYEGGLTTDCPGVKVDYDRQKEVYETALDYTDDRGWHLGEATMKYRQPRFEETKVPPQPPRVDPRPAIAPSIDWQIVDRHAQLQSELVQKAMTWVIAERSAEDASALCTRLEDEVEAREGRDPDTRTAELDKELETATKAFHKANRHAEKCSQEFHQAARRIVSELEEAVGSR